MALKEKVEQLIENDINQALQSHAGFVTLDKVDEEEGKVYLNFMGGCHGCAMASGATLHQIENYLQTALGMPELEVINVEFM